MTRAPSPSTASADKFLAIHEQNVAVYIARRMAGPLNKEDEQLLRYHQIQVAKYKFHKEFK